MWLSITQRLAKMKKCVNRFFVSALLYCLVSPLIFADSPHEEAWKARQEQLKNEHEFQKKTLEQQKEDYKKWLEHESEMQKLDREMIKEERKAWEEMEKERRKHYEEMLKESYDND
jgi:septal ring factor EnvC (AmiA/AmiB activator)